MMCANWELRSSVFNLTESRRPSMWPHDSCARHFGACRLYPHVSLIHCDEPGRKRGNGSASPGRFTTSPGASEQKSHEHRVTEKFEGPYRSHPLNS
jgi:hypothetical protein